MSERKVNEKGLEFGAFDIETDPFKLGRFPKPFCADIFTGEIHQTWWGENCIEKLIEYIVTHPRKWYAHNGGKFDFHYLIPYFRKIMRKFGVHITRFLSIGGRIVHIVFDNACELLDSFALIPKPLRDWAKDDIDYEKLEEKNRSKNCAEIIRYLKGDTENLYEMLSSFFDRYGWHLTLASAAFNILHKEFGVKRVHISESQDAKFRSFYFAGRVEFFDLGNLGGGFSCADINSSFPWSMTLPHWEGENFIASSSFPRRHFKQSFFRIRAESTGAFPFRNEDGSVSFPSDGERREFFVTGWEFECADEYDLLRDVRLVSAFTPTSIRDYSQYIEYFYKIKSGAEQKGDKGERLFAKLLMNSGYGKFGMDPREFEEMALCEFRIPPDNEHDWYIVKEDPKLGISIYARSADNIEYKFNNVCVAASITGCSRALLLRGIMECGDVVYCDTDSIIARDISPLSVGGKLGQWKIENTFSELYIGGKKLYAGFDSEQNKWKTASKGVKLTPEEIKKVALGKDVTYQFSAPSYSIRGNIQNGNMQSWHRFTKRTVKRADKIARS